MAVVLPEMVKAAEDLEMEVQVRATVEGPEMGMAAAEVAAAAVKATAAAAVKATAAAAAAAAGRATQAEVVAAEEAQGEPPEEEVVEGRVPPESPCTRLRSSGW